MRKAICGAAALSLVLALGVSAQGHTHGAPSTGDSAQAAPDTTQSMMQQKMQRMQQRMQDMQARMEGMMQMRGQGEGGAQAMGGMRGMGGQQQEQAMAGTCIMSGPEAALSAALLGSVTDLALSEGQTATLHEILARAQNEALEALTPEQRERLDAAPAWPTCQQPRPEAGATAGP